MIYQRKSNEELRRYRYPNLMAELFESGYSICTLADHMGLGVHRKEDDPEVWDKLNGSRDILASEGIGLSRLFSVSADYLFSDTLCIFSGKPLAYLRWCENNRRKEREHPEYVAKTVIERELSEKPYLLEFMKNAVSWNEEQLNQAILLLKSGNLYGTD